MISAILLPMKVLNFLGLPFNQYNTMELSVHANIRCGDSYIKNFANMLSLAGPGWQLHIASVLGS